jgi:hypothetical protein
MTNSGKKPFEPENDPPGQGAQKETPAIRKETESSLNLLVKAHTQVQILAYANEFRTFDFRVGNVVCVDIRVVFIPWIDAYIVQL